MGPNTVILQRAWIWLHTELGRTEKMNGILKKILAFFFPQYFYAIIYLWLVFAAIFIASLQFEITCFTHASEIVNYAICSPSCDQKIEQCRRRGRKMEQLQNQSKYT